MAKIIFALMGPSGCGKTRLVAEMLKEFPSALVTMRSLTTRPSRGPEDDASYRFIDREGFVALRDANALVNWVEFDGNFYGDTRDDVEAIFAAGKHAIRPMIADGVRNFRAAGYRVPVTNIIPKGAGYKNRSAVREQIDAARAKDPLVPDIDVVNTFDPGGIECAIASLAGYINGYLNGDARRHS